MQFIRNKPGIAFLLLVIALLALGASLYFTFRRAASSPFELPKDVPPTTPPPTSEGEPTTVL